MRNIVAYAVLLVLLAAGSEAQNISTPAQESITDAAIINLCGARFSKMFALLGTPSNIRVDRRDTPEEDEVFCDYGTVGYGFEVRDKIIRTCYFFSAWKNPIRGVKMGFSREDVARVLGTAPIIVKDKNGAVTAYGYELKDLEAQFFANFDEGGKVWRVEVSLK